jgi:hypothetical protein
MRSTLSRKLGSWGLLIGGSPYVTTIDSYRYVKFMHGSLKSATFLTIPFQRYIKMRMSADSSFFVRPVRACALLAQNKQSCLWQKIASLIKKIETKWT